MKSMLLTMMRACLLAFSMLTRLPLHPRGEVSPHELRLSVMFYPSVGAFLGAVLMLVAPALRDLSVAILGGVVLVALLALLTGGLHLDGLADWFDAVGGGRGDRARMLDIMKDPRVGAHGATALVLVLLAKCVTFDAAIDTLTPLQWLMVPTFSRAAIVPLVTWMRPARDHGLAHAVHGASSVAIVFGATLPLVVLLATSFSESAVAAMMTACVTALVIGLWAQRRLGGATGDVYGAALELAELAAAFVLVQRHA